MHISFGPFDMLTGCLTRSRFFTDTTRILRRHCRHGDCARLGVVCVLAAAILEEIKIFHFLLRAKKIYLRAGMKHWWLKWWMARVDILQSLTTGLSAYIVALRSSKNLLFILITTFTYIHESVSASARIQTGNWWLLIESVYAVRSYLARAEMTKICHQRARHSFN